MDIRLVAPLATVLASALATYLWWLNRQRKCVSIFTIRSEPLIAIKGAARKKIRVLFGDKPIHNTFLLQLSLRNDGNVPVALSDYQSPFRIELNADSHILEAEVIESWPADLDRRIPAQSQTGSQIDLGLIKRTGKTWVELTPVLLNPGDEIVLQLLAENFNEQIDVSQHVNGIKRVSFWRENRLIPKTLSAIGALIVVFAAFFLDPASPFVLTLPSIPYILLILLGCLMCAIGLNWPHSERARHFASDNQFFLLSASEKTTAPAERI